LLPTTLQDALLVLPEVFLLWCAENPFAVLNQALASHGDILEDRTEKQIVALLTLPLTSYDPVTVLGLSTYPRVMSLLKSGTCKVCTAALLMAFLKF